MVARRRHLGASQRRQVLRLGHQRRHLGRRHPGGALQGGGQVVRLHQIAHPCARPLRRRQAQDHRQPGAGVVEVGALGDQFVVADHVVGTLSMDEFDNVMQQAIAAGAEEIEEIYNVAEARLR